MNYMRYRRDVIFKPTSTPTLSLLSRKKVSSRRAWEAEAQLAIVRGSLAQSRASHETALARAETELQEARDTVLRLEVQLRDKDSSLAAASSQLAEVRFFFPPFRT